MVTEVDDVYFTVSLLAPDGVQISSPLVVTVPSSAVKASFVTAVWAWPQGNNSLPGSTTLAGILGLSFGSTAFNTLVETVFDSNF